MSIIFIHMKKHKTKFNPFPNWEKTKKEKKKNSQGNSLNLVMRIKIKSHTHVILKGKEGLRASLPTEDQSQMCFCFLTTAIQNLLLILQSI